MSCGSSQPILVSLATSDELDYLRQLITNFKNLYIAFIITNTMGYFNHGLKTKLDLELSRFITNVIIIFQNSPLIIFAKHL